MAEPMRLELERTLDAGPEAVWAVVGGFGHEARWLSALAESQRDTKEVELGTVRQCTFEEPMMARERIEEEVVELVPGRVLAYRTLQRIGPFQYGQARWSLAPAGQGTHLRIEVALMPRNRVFGWLLDPLARRTLRRTAETALDELAAFVEQPRIEVAT